MKAEYHPLEQDVEEQKRESSSGTVGRRKALIVAGVGIGILVSMLFALFAHGGMFTDTLFNTPSTGAEKQGAGILFVSGDEVLLLERNSKHNDKTWGLPGGNVEAGDWTLRDTASREAKEELGSLPQYEIITEIKTRRGKTQQKHYSVFVARLLSPQLEFSPQLNAEHRSFRWFPIAEASKLDNLHPVVDILFTDPSRKKLAAAMNLDPEVVALGRHPKKLGAGLFFPL